MMISRQIVRPLIRLLFLLLPAAAFFIPSGSQAQFYNGSQLTFGKSRVQYTNFMWVYFRFDKFDTYFYQNGRELAEYAAEYADKNIRDIELQLESNLDDKIQFVIFNTLTDLKQSNIGLYGDWDTYNTGGVTRIIGGKVLLYFDGQIRHFEEQIRAGIAQVILNQMVYGTGIGAQIKNNAIFTMPEWYLNGLISYIAKDWTTEIDNSIRDAVLSGKYDKFNGLTGLDAAYAGHSFWHYVALKYGETAIPNIVYMARMSRNIEKGFLLVLGVQYQTLMEDWLKYYKDMYSSQESLREKPAGESALKRIKKDRIYRQFKTSPNGEKLVYSTFDLGVHKIFIKDIETGKKKRIYRGGYRLAEKPDYSYPVVAWHPSGNLLAFMVERKGLPYLYFYNFETKDLQYQIMYNFQKILDMSYSDDGTLLVFSAIQKGQSDIFVFNIASGSHEQITKDRYDDLTPRFINQSTEIIFASNRDSDTIRFDPKIKPGTMSGMNDLFIYRYKSKNRILRRITNTPYVNETQPMPYPDQYLSYLADQNGIYNRFLARFDSTISFIDTATHYRYYVQSFPVTNYSRSILEQDIQPRSGKIADVILEKGSYRLFTHDLIRPKYVSSSKLQNTQVKEAYYTASDRSRKENLPDSAAKGKEERKKGRKKHFSTVKYSDVIKADTLRGDSLYVQGLERKAQFFPSASTDTLLATIQRIRLVEEDTINKFKNAKVLNYNVEYQIDQMVSQVDFTYLNSAYQPFSGIKDPIFVNPGLNALFMVGITDLMEDYRITGGVRLNFDLVNNEYLLSYTNYKHRLDHQVVYHRQGVEEIGYYSYVRHKINEVFYVATYPFNPVLNIKGTASVRYDRSVFLATDQVNLRLPDINKVWGSLKAELTYDNTRDIGLNLYKGTRYKIFGEYYQLLEKGGTNVTILGFDFRNYQQIHRSLIWANRLAASTSFGTGKLVYYMGGVDNWLFPRFNPNTPVAPDQNYVFQTLATNMRGFDQNIRNGNSFILFSSELRMPVFRYLFNRPIRSDFLNNFQVVVFGDIGTAWTGPTPYSEENQLFTQYYYRQPLFIKVQLQKEPMVEGFGGGLRTRIFGYFIRGDVAWGVEDGHIGKAIFYLSLSLDF
jgi:hypothetical protein